MRTLSVLVLAASLAAAGCSGKVRVTGRLVNPDGSPATDFAGATVELSPVEGVYGSQGKVGADGTFTVSSDTPGDWTPPGKYKVVVRPGNLAQEEMLAAKFRSKQTTPVEVEVQAGMKELTVTVEKEPRKPGGKPPAS